MFSLWRIYRALAIRQNAAALPLLNDLMIQLFQAFFSRMKARFSQLARSTRNEKEVGDLHNDAIVIALEIGDRRGRPIDLTDATDQDLVMRELYLENVKRADWKMRYAVRIDHEPDRDEEGIALIERLPAQASSDPLVSLLAKESPTDPAAPVEKSYSQAAAYLVTFDRFRNDRQRICAHLAISEGVLWRRVSDAAATYRRQPSVFDGKERIPATFTPLRGRRCAAKIGDAREAGQWSLNFEADEKLPA